MEELLDRAALEEVGGAGWCGGQGREEFEGGELEEGVVFLFAEGEEEVGCMGGWVGGWVG